MQGRLTIVNQLINVRCKGGAIGRVPESRLAGFQGKVMMPVPRTVWRPPAPHVSESQSSTSKGMRRRRGLTLQLYALSSKSDI